MFSRRLQFSFDCNLQISKSSHISSQILIPIFISLLFKTTNSFPLVKYLFSSNTP